MVDIGFSEGGFVELFLGVVEGDEILFGDLVVVVDVEGGEVGGDGGVVVGGEVFVLEVAGEDGDGGGQFEAEVEGGEAGGELGEELGEGE